MRHVFYRIGIIFALLITMGATSVSASNAHHCLIGEPITMWKTTDYWSKNYEEFALTSPANTNWDEFCIYMWVEKNQTFAFNNHFFNPNPEDAKQVGPSSDQATINKDGGTGVGVATDGTTNAWKYTGATGLVKICAAQSSGGNGQGEWKPYVWVEESKEIEILKGNKIMFYFGSSTGKGEHNWLYLSATSTTSHSASEQYHRLNETKCTSYISVAYVDAGIRYYISDYSSWAGVQMESTAEAGCLYSVYNDGSDKIYKNVADDAIPHFATTTVNKTVGTVDSEIAATATNSIYGNKQVLYYYYTTDGGTTFTKFDPSDIRSLAVGVYTIYALGWDGHILVRSDNTVTLNVGVTISLNANGGTDGDVTSVFATSGIAASTGNIAVASLPTKTGYTFNGFRTSGGIEVINENGEWKTDVSGYTDNSGNWICSAASTLYAHWTPNSYIVTLEGMEADGESLPISVDVTYDAKLSSLKTKHTKAHYDLLGYWAASDDKGEHLTDQLINANGNWILDVTGYTGNDGAGQPTWVHDFNISLFAQWTEQAYTITPSVSPAGAGSVNTVTDAHLVTPSSDITAKPTNAVWVFDYWTCGTNVGIAGGKGTGDNPVTVTASQNSTITAYFKRRYNLLGSKYEEGKGKAEMETGGMPGWTYGSGADFTINSYTADGDDATVDLSYTCTLEAGTYIFEIHDRQKGESLGREGDGGGIYQLTDGNSVQLRGGTDKDQSIFFYPQHAGQYTFRITYMTKDGNYYYPTVTIERPHQLHMGHVYAGIDNTSGTNSGDTGGTLTAAISESSISNGDWFNYGSDIAYTASPATGYTVTWYTDDNYSSEFGDQPSNSWTDYNVTHDENVYVRFIETSTSVTLANDGHGHVEINDETVASTTVGVTTTRELTAMPNEGYKFSGWTLPENADFEVIEGDEKNPTITLRGKGAGTKGEIIANFTAREYTVTLEGMDADSDDPILVNVTYDAVLPSLETKHTKAHYALLGYWAASDDKGEHLTDQLIEADGNWIPDVAGYTGKDGAGQPTWVHDFNISLFAKWEEHPYTVDLKVDPEGAGTIDKGATIEAYYVTASDDIRAEPNTGYSFTEWDFSKTGEDNDVYSAEGYSSLSNPICVLAQHDGTLTAKFTANNYNVNLENLGADEGYKGTENVSVTYNSSANLTENITIPQKAHYDFGGYWTEANGSGHQLIDTTGAWIASVDGYTDSDKNWLYADNLTLYAKWTEHPYTIDLVVSPEGAGTIKIGEDVVGSVNAFISTQTDLITATPANPAWKFKGWQYSENVGPADGTGNDNTVQIRAEQDGTLTAVFEPRFCLVGSIWDDSGNGGMPGWHDYTADFMVNSYTDLSTMNLTCVRSLDPNTTYKFEVHDKVNGKNLGYATPSTYIGDQSLLFNTRNNDVFLRVNGHGECTFTISALSSGDLYPTVSVAIPASHQLNLEWAYVRINGDWYKTSDDVGGTVSAQTTESGRHFDIQNDEYVAHGGAITYTATPATGYTFEGWYNNDYNTRFSTTNPYTSSNIQTTENVEAKFLEKATAVTLSNDGHGKVQIGGEDATSTTCGVTTTRELTAVPNAGYKFSSWSKSGDDITLSSTSTNPTTLTGLGAGAASGQTLTANFEERYSIKGTMHGENWGTTHTLSNIGTNAGSKDTCYVTMTLPANTTYEFAIYDEQTGGWYKAGTDTVYDMTYTNHTNWEFGDTKTYNCGITTAGKGTYKFIFNITDKTVTVVYPTSYQVNYGAAVGGSVTSVLDDDGEEIPNGGYVREGGSVTYEATANDGYTFTGWCPDDSYGDIFTDINPWENSSITATSNAYAKFHSTNFVIYRTGDKSSDPRRAVWDDVESYEGGTISETIEFRMKVNKLDFWYTLCLPFEVNTVRVWEDGEYYDIVPYWRTNSTYNTGHYILRKPVTTTNFAIEGFEGKDRWIDPKSSDVLPSKNIPYIIQWHDEYFLDKYISFFGPAGQIIPTAMDKGSYASSDETVNIYGNNSMTTGTVRDAYLLDPYYGSDGAWMREEIGTDRSVLPFECFILANPATTAKYRVLRRDMADDTPTGLDTLSMTEDSVSKVMINNRIYIIRGGKMYTIQGTFVKEVE